MWIPIFVVGSFWFWLLLLLSFIVLVLCVEWEAPFKAFGAILVTVGLLVLFGTLDPFDWIANHPGQVIGSIVGYFLLGTVWSLVKWWMYVGQRKEYYEDIKIEWLKEKGIKESVVPEELRDDWVKYLKNKSWRRSFEDYTWIPPQALQYKSKIMIWMAYWPWSMFWSLFDDVIRKIFSTIYAKLANTFQRISVKVYGNVARDFVGTEEWKTITKVYSFNGSERAPLKRCVVGSSPTTPTEVKDD